MSRPTSLAGRTPVTIITGFLGSGKTTLLNHILGTTRLGRVAALVNDFGAVNIDAALVSAVADDVVQLSNGCVCCTINGDLLAAAERVLALDPPVDRIVVETTGLADPLPVGMTFLQTELRERTSLESVITVVDCENFVLDLFKSDAAMAQIVHGDFIVLNKTDLVTAATITSLERRIAVIKPKARILHAVHGQVPFVTVADPLPSDPRPFDAAHNADRATVQHVADDGFEAHTFRFDEPLSAERFQSWLTDSLPEGLFRAKGFVRFDRPAGVFLFQLCGTRAAFDPYPSPNAGPGSEIVFIGRDLSRDDIAQCLATCTVEAPAAVPLAG